MNILFLYHRLRMNGIGFLRSRYFVEDLEKRGHNVRLAYIIVDDRSEYKDHLQDDVISFDEVTKFLPDVLIFELGGTDRFPNREWLNKFKGQGGVILHCGLDYNNYNGNRERYDEMYEDFGCGIRKKKDDNWELPDIRGSDMTSHVTQTDVETLKEYCSIQEPKVFEGVSWVSSHQALVIHPFKHVLLTAGPHSFIKAYNDDIHGENYAIYGAFNDTAGIEILITGHFVTDGKERAEREYNRTFLINVLEYFHIFNPAIYKSTQQARGSVNLEIEKEESVSEGKGTPNHERLIELRQVLTDRFDDSELRNLCFDLCVDYDSLQGQSKGDKARELIAYLERRGRIDEFVRIGKKLRPDVTWN